MATSETSVELELRIVDDTRSTTIAFADGTMMRHPTTGLETEKWFWLPRKLIKIEAKRMGSKDCFVTMPRWLAEDRGLV